jgi:hypothetical protein
VEEEADVSYKLLLDIPSFQKQLKSAFDFKINGHSMQLLTPNKMYFNCSYLCALLQSN